MNRIAFIAARVRDSFWFVPAVAIALAIVLAESVVLLDRALDVRGLLIIDVGPDGARGLLAAIATSMLAAAATMFSITIAVLALTASAYGPRLVRNFMADRGNQLVLAVLVSTALYALLVLRRVRSGDSNEFVPSAGVSLALGLTVLCIVLLIYFIHHISTSIQISTLASQVRVELGERMKQSFPDEADADRRHDSQWPTADGAARAVAATRDGYVADIGVADLVTAARGQRARVDVVVRPGTFVCVGDTLAEIALDAEAPDDTSIDERLSSVDSGARAAIAIRNERTPYQDVEHLARQLVDIAVRAISPGVNDPYTAVAAIDALAAAFATTAANDDPPPVIVDDDGDVRVRLAQRSWSSTVVDTVDAIRVYCAGQPVVAERLLDLLGRLAAEATDETRQADLRAAAKRVVDGVASPAMQSYDLDRILDAATWAERDSR